MGTTDAVKVEWSAGGVVVRTLGPEHHVLLIRDPYRNWGLPKGHVEEGEEPHVAALREVREETGLEELVLGPGLGVIDWYFRLDGRSIHKHCHFFLMASPSGVPRPEMAEGITACRWLPVEDAVRSISYENARQVVRRAAARLRPVSGADSLLPWR